MPGAAVVMLRADASPVVGAGHVMRCLALAGALARRGARAVFASHAMPAPLAQRLAARGIAMEPVESGNCDAATSLAAARRVQADAVVVDHYGLDATWERAQRAAVRRVMAIDDLADRGHDADLLLDQNLGRLAGDYDARLPAACRRLIGPRHALVRPEFAAARPASLQRRAAGRLEHLVVSVGGGDQQGSTLRVLHALLMSPRAAGLRLTVVLGPLAATLQPVRAVLAEWPGPAALCMDVDNMATLLADADLAVGAAGGSAWERCCLGVPTLLMVLADNQRAGAQALADAGAAHRLDAGDDLQSSLPGALEALALPERLRAMSQAAAAVTDGLGAERVADALLASLQA
jgi:UDP-2,4-diacetamido-2,4,6-trideoxy-beta-L-altropyranose hydrolase